MEAEVVPPICPFLQPGPEGEASFCLSRAGDRITISPRYVDAYCVVAEHVHCSLYLHADPVARGQAEERRAAIESAAAIERNAALTTAPDELSLEDASPAEAVASPPHAGLEGNARNLLESEDVGDLATGHVGSKGVEDAATERIGPESPEPEAERGPLDQQEPMIPVSQADPSVVAPEAAGPRQQVSSTGRSESLEERSASGAAAKRRLSFFPWRRRRAESHGAPTTGTGAPPLGVAAPKAPGGPTGPSTTSSGRPVPPDSLSSHGEAISSVSSRPASGDFGSATSTETLSTTSGDGAEPADVAAAQEPEAAPSSALESPPTEVEVAEMLSGAETPPPISVLAQPVDLVLPLPAQPVSAEAVVGTPSTITLAEATPTPSHHIEPTPVRAVPVGQSGTVSEPWAWPADLSSRELVGPAQPILAVPVPTEAAAEVIEIRDERARPEVADAGIEVRNERVPDESTEEDEDVSSLAQRPQAEESAGAVGTQAPHVAPAGDSTAPAEPSIQFPEDGSVLPGGPLNILGVAPGAARVEIFDWLHPIGQARVEEDGSWALRFDRFEDGTHMLTARSADGAGALSSPSRPSVVTLGDSAAAAASRARRRRRMFLALGVILVILVVVVVAAFLGLRHGS